MRNKSKPSPPPSFRKPRSGCPESITPVWMTWENLWLWIPGSRTSSAPRN